MHNEWAQMSASGTVTPQAVQIVFWALFLVSVSVYAIGVGQATLNHVSGAQKVDAIQFEGETDEMVRMKSTLASNIKL
jgi:hypothetical protein